MDSTESNNFIELENNIKEGLPDGNKNFFFDIPEGFFNWFVENSKLFTNVYSAIPEKVKVNKTMAANCFHNSQLISLENKDVNYYEGIIIGAKSTNSTHHGFNLVDNKVLDVTSLMNAKAFFEEWKDESFYFLGVKIENDFIEQNPKVATANDLDNALLLNYFLKMTSNKTGS